MFRLPVWKTRTATKKTSLWHLWHCTAPTKRVLDPFCSSPSVFREETAIALQAKRWKRKSNQSEIHTQKLDSNIHLYRYCVSATTDRESRAYCVLWYFGKWDTITWARPAHSNRNDTNTKIRFSLLAVLISIWTGNCIRSFAFLLSVFFLVIPLRVACWKFFAINATIRQQNR